MNSRIHLAVAALLVGMGTTVHAAGPEPAAQDQPSMPTPHPVQTESKIQVPSLGFAPANAEPQAAPTVVAGGHDAGDEASRLWASADVLLWWVRGAQVPPLVTTSPAGTPQTAAGVLGTPGTAILFGGSALNTDIRSGGRFSIGAWIDPQEKFAVEGNFFILANESARFEASSSGSPILARPFLNAQTTTQDSELVAFPGVLAGKIAINSTSDGPLGAEVNFKEVFSCACCPRLTALVGYRFLQYDENLNIDEALTASAATNPFGVAAGTQIAVSDRFNTKNEFHGGNFGLLAQFQHQRLSADLLTKLAVGYNRELVEINGSTQVSVPGQPVTTSRGGLFALPTNIGHFNRDEVAVIPEFGLNVGYQVTDYLRVYAGYTFLYWSSVVRAGNQVDFTVNPSQLPPNGALVGPARPGFQFQESDLWVQGINLGLELRY